MLENLVHQVILAKKKRGRREASGSVWSQAGQCLDGMGAQVPDSQAPRPAGEGQISKACRQLSSKESNLAAPESGGGRPCRLLPSAPEMSENCIVTRERASR